MHIEFKNSDNKTIGIAELTDKGNVRFVGKFAPKVRETVIIQPGTMKKLTPADGEAYLRALPATFRPPYFWAKVIEND